MDVVSLFKSQKKQIIAFFISILVVIACFYGGWILVVLSPVIVFLVFKFLKVWKSKERVGYGLPAIIIAVAIFMLIYAYQTSNIPSQKFYSDDNALEVAVSPYTTTDYSKNFSIYIVYNKMTNSTMHYQILDAIHNQVVDHGNLSGVIKDNKTYYNLTRSLGEGMYSLEFSVDNHVVSGEIIKEKPEKLYQYFMYYSGFLIIGLLSILYLLFIFGVHIIRRGKDMARLRYEGKT